MYFKNITKFQDEMPITWSVFSCYVFSYNNSMALEGLSNFRSYLQAKFEYSPFKALRQTC